MVEAPGGGRGNAPVVWVMFAQAGPWVEGDVNAPLFEAVLSYAGVRGSSRLLLAALAALADDELAVTGARTEELRVAAGLADSTYRRARAALVAGGELTLVMAGGGRARTNAWVLRDPRSNEAPRVAIAPRTRVAPRPAARPLVAAVTAAAADTSSDTTFAGAKGPGSSGVSGANPAQGRTVWAGKGPGLSGVSARNHTQGRTVSPKTPPETPPQTPPPNARAGREPQNPRTQKGPLTPLGHESSAGSMAVEESYLTDRGRRRRRKVYVDLDQVRRGLALPTTDDRGDWERIRGLLAEAVGESRFAIWLAPLDLVAIDLVGKLVIGVPPQTAVWVWDRFGRALSTCARRLGRELRIATEPERAALERDRRRLSSDARGCHINQREVS